MNKHEWILDVFDDLAAYAVQHELHGLVKDVERGKKTARAEIFSACASDVAYSAYDEVMAEIQQYMPSRSS